MHSSRVFFLSLKHGVSSMHEIKLKAASAQALGYKKLKKQRVQYKKSKEKYYFLKAAEEREEEMYK
jgi:hypothetical protein